MVRGMLPRCLYMNQSYVGVADVDSLEVWTFGQSAAAAANQQRGLSLHLSATVLLQLLKRSLAHLARCQHD